MLSKLLVDTDILVDFVRGFKNEGEFLSRLQGRWIPAVSIVTRMELLAGCRNSAELRKVDGLLARQFQLIGLSEAIGTTAADLLHRYRLSHGITIPDALIAATALAESLPLITRNQREFRFIKGMELLPHP